METKDYIIMVLVFLILIFTVNYLVNKHDELVEEKTILKIAMQINETGEFPILSQVDNSTTVTYMNFQSIYNQGYLLGEIDLSERIWANRAVPILSALPDGTPTTEWIGFDSICGGIA